MSFVKNVSDEPIDLMWGAISNIINPDEIKEIPNELDGHFRQKFIGRIVPVENETEAMIDQLEKSRIKEIEDLKCDKCDFIAKSAFGLQSHKRIKHSKEE